MRCCSIEHSSPAALRRWGASARAGGEKAVWLACIRSTVLESWRIAQCTLTQNQDEAWFDSQDHLHENGRVRHASDFQFAHARNVRSRMAR